ncbi:hypothetical protein SLH46_15595 [Draconibacterium sp. IB214405]|uniref:hypothetical protein n=1 Tax=Draconibacterium sp. IB214405 TaxID=3097352 RepID=UPI002A170307|nr:hypothetical protein [Draconibacterium sp. IB214405]MDX8340621.1 hypothetical protein [Draconibacterium sp. IB214405]
MNTIIGTIVIISYFIVLLRFFPFGRRTLDVFNLSPHLLPFWCKFVGMGWLLFVFCYSIIQGDTNPSTNPFLLSGIYFGLLQIAFSKEKNDDEFAEQIRMKAMYISMISFFFLAGIYSGYEIIEPNSFSENSFVWFMMLLNATFIVYLSYFYFTKYRSLKNQN